MPSKKTPYMFKQLLETMAKMEVNGMKMSEEEICNELICVLEQQCKRIPSTLKQRVKKAIKFGLDEGVLLDCENEVHLTMGPLSIDQPDSKKRKRARKGAKVQGRAPVNTLDGQAARPEKPDCETAKQDEEDGDGKPSNQDDNNMEQDSDEDQGDDRGEEEDDDPENQEDKHEERANSADNEKVNEEAERDRSRRAQSSSHSSRYVKRYLTKLRDWACRNNSQQRPQSEGRDASRRRHSDSSDEEVDHCSRSSRRSKQK